MLIRAMGFLVSVVIATIVFAEVTSVARNQKKYEYASSLGEARSRALMLYELANGSLQVIHRDFFEKDSTRTIPSSSLEDVFKEMDKSFGVKMRWLRVNADVVNFEHEAKTEFEKLAVEQLDAGQAFAEELGEKEFRFAGSIRLSSRCLSCHLQARKSTDDRLAGLVIIVPIQSR